MGKIHMLLREIHHIGKATRESLVHPEHCPIFLRQGIVLAGISQASAKFHFVRLRPERMQILVCFRGEGRVWVDGTWRKCGAGMAYITPPEKFHAYRASRKWEVGWVMCGKAASRIAMVDQPTLIDVDPRPLEYILRGLHHEVSTHREPGALEHWSGLLHDEMRRMAGSRQSTRLWHLWETVRCDLGAPWDLASLACMVKLGPEQLRRLCRRETGASPMRHVTHLRIRHSVALLASGRKIEDVARMVGYENAFAFSTAFRRIMGQPPSAFRRTG